MNKRKNTGSAAAAKTQPGREASDERLTRSASSNVRGERGLTAEESDRTGDSGLLSDDELKQLIRDEFEQTALPQPPAIPGWHTCWLTTTSQYDTLPKRMRIGYIPVKRAEMEGFDPSNGQSLANYEGFVTCNEMVLCKIPERNYQTIMRHFHHDRPLEEETVVVEQIKRVTGHASQEEKRELLSKDMGDGTMELEQSVEQARKLKPTFV